ncbi:MAG: RHS repeat-associated core domain-containing protein, partial [Dehalococcoidia bacterium]
MPSTAATTYAFDARGLLTSVSDALNHVTTYGYDDAGRRVTVTDPNNATTTMAYDAAGHLTSLTDALTNVVRFGFDAAGQQTSITNARGKTTSVTYDPLGHPLTRKDPLNRTTSFQYDSLGELTQTTDGRGTVVGFAYDAAGNRTAETFPSNGSVTWAYDAANRRTSMTDPLGTTTWSYDAASRTTSVGAPQGTVGYSYNADGSRAAMTLPGSKSVSYGYDSAGRLNAVSDWLNRTVGFSYDIDGHRAGITRPNGVTTSETYDAAGRLTGISHTGPNSTTLRHFSYTLDAAGNRPAVASEGGSETYTLDAANRLTNATYPQGDTASYSYDGNGNMLTKKVGSTTTTYSYDDADQLLSDGATSSTYDQNGNTLTAGSSAYTWDFANRMTSASAGGTSTSYSYDGEDTRVGKTAGGATTSSFWDREAGPGLLAGDGTTSYLSDTGSMLGQLDGSGTPSYYLGDALGSVRGQSGMTGTLSGGADYDVFGAARTGSSLSSSFSFAGEQSDPETGFSFLRSRSLNPGTGRFLSADSVTPNADGTQGYNPYAYVANNPTTSVDPTGHDAFGDTLGALRQGPPVLQQALDAAMRGAQALNNVALDAGSGFSLDAVDIQAACELTPACLVTFLNMTRIAAVGAATALIPGIGYFGIWIVLAATIGVTFAMIACAIDIQVTFNGGESRFFGCGGLAMSLHQRLHPKDLARARDPYVGPIPGIKAKGQPDVGDPAIPTTDDNSSKAYRIRAAYQHPDNKPKGYRKAGNCSESIAQDDSIRVSTVEVKLVQFYNWCVVQPKSEAPPNAWVPVGGKGGAGHAVAGTGSWIRDQQKLPDGRGAGCISRQPLHLVLSAIDRSVQTQILARSWNLS